jgi:hypothetical protein
MAKKVGENQWLIELKENQETKELYLDLPLDALSQVGWDEGDTLIWEELDNGNWRISKKEES